MRPFTRRATRIAGRAAVATLLTVVSTAALMGCFTSSGSCVDYAAPLPVAARIARADLVAVVTFTDTSRTVRITAVYPVHEAHVSRVLHGTQPRRRILVTVVPGDCVTTGQPATCADGDPLDTDTSAVLLLDGPGSDGVHRLAPWDVVSQDEYDAALAAGRPRPRPPAAGARDDQPRPPGLSPVIETDGSAERDRPQGAVPRGRGSIADPRTRLPARRAGAARGV